MKTSKLVSQWRREGEKRGERIGFRNGLTRILQVRFGDALPADILAALECADMAELERLADESLTAESLEDFRKTLRRPAT